MQILSKRSMIGSHMIKEDNK